MIGYRTASALALALTLVIGTPTQACLHLPADYSGSIEQLAQGGLIFYANGREDLILNNAFLVSGDAKPESLAWVVPVPSAPIAYSEVEGDVFGELFKRWESERGIVRDRSGLVLRDTTARSRGAKSLDLGDVQVVETLGVGAYEVTVLQATNAESLNGWLRQHGFGTVPPENMAFYLEHEHHWVCVKTAPEGLDGELKPLRISFKTPKIVYPLKFSSHQGTFNVNLWVVTEEPLPLPKAAGPGERIDVREARVNGQTEGGFRIEGRWLPLPKAPAQIAKELGILNTLGFKIPYVTKVSTRQLRGASVSTWGEDLEIRPPAGSERLEKPPEVELSSAAGGIAAELAGQPGKRAAKKTRKKK